MKCENPKCNRELTADHITMITSTHVRRFCVVPCLIESYETHMDNIMKDAGLVRKDTV